MNIPLKKTFVTAVSLLLALMSVRAQYVKIADSSAMLSNLLRKSDTASMLKGYARKGQVVKYSDTAIMLSNLLRKTDTASMLSGYAKRGQVVKYSDTTAMLSNLLRKSDTASMLKGYARKGQVVKYSDTAGMLSNLLRKTDTAVALNNYLRKTDTASMLSNYSKIGVSVKYSDTAAMLTNLLRRSDTAAMLNGYSKTGMTVKYTDTSAMLSNYTKSGLAVKYTDTAAMLANQLRKSDTTAMLAGYARAGQLSGPSNYLPKYGNTSPLSNSLVYDNGTYVGIGTANPQSLLSVNGVITATKLVITTTGWSDFVFNSNYRLRPLHELEAFINANKHLPDVPSAKEVETKGISVGDNQAILLRKIEELSLYIINQQKQLDHQAKQIQLLMEKKAAKKKA